MTPKKTNPVNRNKKKFRLHRWILPIVLAGLCATAWGLPAEAQPELDKRVLKIGDKTLTVEVADDEAERAAGLMFRPALGTDAGMLFVMPTRGPVGFWMKNTPLPLSIAYLDNRGVIREFHDLEPFSEAVVSSRFTDIRFALEVPRGWFVKNNIWPGERVTGLPRVD